ncbi:hypothetical protein OH76DRAFT_1484425 [Lentinus brumalis]|uniref:Uncharacterized protein n=1 Tax=Lentinus brumalis TaxID=2498619 RepID=A0A371D5C7_9APHY|nr:hypothetical protein OH76DRAFT_1484425 [Polyporus brumalis]
MGSRQCPDKVVAVYRDFAITRDIDKNGEIIPLKRELYKEPMPADKMMFAPTFQIVNLFDPMPFQPTLANDLSSFTQVFIHTLLAQRITEGVITRPELTMYRKMLEMDPDELRSNRDSQCRDVRAIIAYYDGCLDTSPDAESGRFGDMVSVMKFLWLVLQVNNGQGITNRLPSQWTRYEGDPTKAAEEYDHYRGQFQVLAEDYDSVQAQMKADMDASFARLREKSRKKAEADEAGKKAAESDRAPVKATDVPSL